MGFLEKIFGDVNEKEVKKLDRIADTEMIEPKGYVFVGSSRMRLHNYNMPSFEEIMEFSRSLGEIVGMDIIKQKQDSRVVLLAKEGVETDVRKCYGLDL